MNYKPSVGTEVVITTRYPFMSDRIGSKFVVIENTDPTTNHPDNPWVKTNSLKGKKWIIMLPIEYIEPV